MNQPDPSVSVPAARRRRWPWVLLALVVLGVLALALAPGALSGVVARAAVASFNDERHGRLELEALELGWTGRQALRRAQLFDPEGRPIASVSVELPALLELARGGGARLGRVVVRAQAELSADDAGVTNLDRALALRAERERPKSDGDDDSEATDLGDLLRRLQLELEVVVERLSWSDRTTRAAGQPFVLENLELALIAQPGEPLQLNALGALAGLSSGAVAAKASVAELFRGAALNPQARFELDAQLDQLPSALVDTLAQQGGLVALALGPSFSVRAKGSGTFTQGALELSVAGADGRLTFTGEVADGVLGGRTPCMLELALTPDSAALERVLRSRLPADVSLAAVGAPSVQVQLDELRVELSRVLEAANSGGDVAASAAAATRMKLSASTNAWRASGPFIAGDALELGAVALRASVTAIDGKGALALALDTQLAAASKSAQASRVELSASCPDIAQALGVTQGGLLAPTQLRLSLSQLPQALLTALAPASAETIAKLPSGALSADASVEVARGEPARVGLRTRLSGGAEPLALSVDAFITDPLGVHTGRPAGVLPAARATASFEGFAELVGALAPEHAQSVLELLGKRVTTALAFEPARDSVGVERADLALELAAANIDFSCALALRDKALSIDSSKPLALDVRVSQALVDRHVGANLPQGAALSLSAAQPQLSLRVSELALPLAAWLADAGAAPISLGQTLRGTHAAARIELPALTFSQPAVGGGKPVPVELQSLAMTARLAAARPASCELRGAIVGGATSALELRASCDDIGAFVDGFAAPGALPPGAALKLAGDVASLPTALLDALAAQNGLLVDVLGDRMDFKLAGAWPSAPGDPLRAEFTSPTARMTVEAGLEGLLLKSADTGGLQAQLPLSPLFSERIVGKLVPLCVNASKPQGAAPVSLNVRDFQLPLDGDLSKLNALVELELGEIVYDLLPGLSSALAPLGLSGASRRTTKLGKLSLPIRNGVVSYERLPLSLGGKELAFKGAFDLSKLEFDFSTDVPLEALGSKVNAELDKVRKYLDPKLLVPVQLKGTWKSPKLRLADDFTKKVLKDAAAKAAEDALKGGLQDLLGGKKKRD